METKAQALLELAIFGALIIMLLGVMVNYGLRYRYQQEVTQEAFHRALASAANSTKDNTPASVTHTVLRDRHIPDPSNPWGVGSVLPIVSGAMVISNPKLHETADKESELPRMEIDVNGITHSFTTAGLREESDVAPDTIDRYIDLFGMTVQGCTEFNLEMECITWEPIKDTEGDISANVGKGDTGINLADYIVSISPDADSYDTYAKTWEEMNVTKILYIDPNGGQIMNFDSAVSMCRNIVDSEVCQKSCLSGKEGRTDNPDPADVQDCANLCSKEIRPPWYCEDKEEVDTASHRYTFHKLENLFSAVPNKQMGLRPDYTKATIINNRLTKIEGPEGITTVDTVDLKDTTTRWIVFLPSPAEPNLGIGTTEVQGNVTQTRNEEEFTPWQ